MSLKNALSELRKLTYADMMILSAELATQITSRREEADNINVIANVLANLNVKGAEPSDLEKQEDLILKQIFKVKRQIIMKYEQGFSMSIPTLQASTVIGLSPRQMFPQMIDQIVTMHALTKGTK